MTICYHITSLLLLLTSLGCAPVSSDKLTAGKGNESVNLADKQKEKPWGKMVGGLQTRIWFEPDHSTFAHGEKIVVRFALRNGGDHNQTILIRGFWPNHRVDVFKGDALAPLTKEGSEVRKLFGMGGTEEKTAPRIVKPEGVVESYRPVELTGLFDLSQPGEYRVRITYQDSEPVPSNDLVFIIK